jgi:hypothetical protein
MSDWTATHDTFSLADWLLILAGAAYVWICGWFALLIDEAEQDREDRGQ